jgi:hypothetical protein
MTTSCRVCHNSTHTNSGDLFCRVTQSPAHESAWHGICARHSASVEENQRMDRRCIALARACLHFRPEAS